MKIVYPICCGIDVHKSFLVATIVSVTKLRTLTYKKERFSTFNKDLFKLKNWLIENNCYDVCTESTGKYWVPVLNVLEPELRVVIVNPKWVKAIKGNKDDVKDSETYPKPDIFTLTLPPFFHMDAFMIQNTPPKINHLS